MQETLLTIVRIGMPLSVMTSMFAQGLTILPGQLHQFKERPWLMLGSLGMVLVLVPATALALIVLLKPAPAVAIGLSILLASPAAPMMLVKVPKKGGNLAYLASLHLCLALLALLSVPVTLMLFSKALSFQVDVNVFALARVVCLTIFVPVGLGIVVRSYFSKVADRIAPALARGAGIALLVLGLVVLAMVYRLLLKMEPWSYFVMAAVVIVSLAIGHWLGPHDAHERTTLAMECAARHPGLAMTIATLNFNPQQALPVLIPYLIVFMVITTVYLQWRNRGTEKGRNEEDATAGQ